MERTRADCPCNVLIRSSDPNPRSRTRYTGRSFLAAKEHLDHTKGFTAKIEHLGREIQSAATRAHTHTRAHAHLDRYYASYSHVTCASVYVDCSTENGSPRVVIYSDVFQSTYTKRFRPKNWRRFWRCVKHHRSDLLRAPSKHECRFEMWLVSDSISRQKSILSPALCWKQREILFLPRARRWIIFARCKVVRDIEYMMINYEN